MLACAILVANNLRDLPRDAEAGKRTLAVLLGDKDTRALYSCLILLPFVVPVALYGQGWTWGLLVLGAFPVALYQYRHRPGRRERPRPRARPQGDGAARAGVRGAARGRPRASHPSSGSGPSSARAAASMRSLIRSARACTCAVKRSRIPASSKYETHRADREGQDDEQQPARPGDVEHAERSEQHTEAGGGVDPEGAHEGPNRTAVGDPIYSRRVTRALPLLLLVGFLVYCLVDCAQTPEERVKVLPKVIWIILILIIPVVGGVVWLVAGHAWGPAGSGSGGSGGSGGFGGFGSGGPGVRRTVARTRRRRRLPARPELTRVTPLRVAQTPE